MNNYWSQNNTIPSSATQVGTYHQYAGNNITIRGNDILEKLPSQTPSKNMGEAALKVLRFYRKFCRMVPFLLRIHNMYTKVTPRQAMNNVANILRERSHFRDPNLVDHHVQRSYEYLYETEVHFSQHTLIQQFLAPYHSVLNDRGYSYLQSKQYGQRTKFLKDFYSGNKPINF